MDNEATDGGAVYLVDVSANISFTSFDSNEAVNGGAVSLDCLDSAKDCKYFLISNQFTNNSASESGGSINWAGKEPNLDSCDFKNNKAVYGSDFASYAVELQIISSNSSANRRLDTLENIPSSQKFPYEIKFGLIDKYSQIVNHPYEAYEVIISGASNVTVSGTTQVTAKQGIIAFTDLYVTATPGNKTYLTVTCSSLNDNLEFDSAIKSSLEVSISMRECIIGEYQLKDQCIVCTVGTYSLNPTQQCTNCPSNAVCYGDYTMAPKPGYYHNSITSANFYECLKSSACLGGLIDDLGYISNTGECATGYRGHLCAACDDGYSPSGSYSCAKCPIRSVNIIRLIGIASALFFVCGILVRSTLKSAYEVKSVNSIYIKVLLNYIQLVSLTSKFRLSWPDEVDSLLATQGQAGEVSSQLFSIDCFLIDDDDKDSYKKIYFQKLVILAFIPVFLGLVSLAF